MKTNGESSWYGSRDGGPGGARPILALAILAALLALWTTQGAAAQSVAPWTLTQISPADDGTTGARQPDIGADGSVIAFRHDGTGPDPDDNPEGDREIFVWIDGSGMRAMRRRPGRADGSKIGEDRPTVSQDGSRVAFASDDDLDPRPGGPGNAEGNAEAMLIRALRGGPAARAFAQLSDGPEGSAVESPALSSDGRVVAFWHDGDLTGDNPDGGLELFRAELDGRIDQLTDLTGRPFHGPPDISADGSRITFIAESDLSGDNADGSWELFLWEGPPAMPGDPARFRQLTDWQPPMTGREIYDASISDDGRRVAFAGRGHVDRSLPDEHVPLEIYLWRDGAGLERLTTATGGRASSLSPRIAAGGQAVVFLSLSDFGGGNANGNAELYLWSEGGGITQITDTTGRPRVTSIVPELIPGLDGGALRAAYISETVDDPAPLVLTSRLGILFRADRPVPAIPSPTAGPSPPPEPAGSVCPNLAARVPPAVIAAALASPGSVEGWLQPANPALPPGWNNPPRTWLALRDWSKPFGPFNSVIWKVGCP